MIRRLRARFIAIAMGAALVVVAAVVAAINLAYLYSNTEELDQRLNILCELEQSGFIKQFMSGEMSAAAPPEIPSDAPENPAALDRAGRHGDNPEFRYQVRYFTAEFDGAGESVRVDVTHIAALTEDEALALAKRSLSRGGGSGYSGVYRYRAVASGENTIWVFLDCRNEIDQMRALLLVSLAVSGAALMAVLGGVCLLSKRAIQPIADSIARQRQFITDAGHELKTPLTIISANTEVLAMDLPENQWLDSIRHQTARLRRLVNNMVTLSEVDEERPVLEAALFSLSDAAYDTAMAFEAPAVSQHKRLTVDVAPGVDIVGDEAAIRQLVSILMDNAVKYCDEGGEISVSLTGGKHARLVVSNTFAASGGMETAKLFDRFYRADKARARSAGSFGLGLSIAQSIVQSHRGKIAAADGGGKAVFIVTLPIREARG